MMTTNSPTKEADPCQAISTTGRPGPLIETNPGTGPELGAGPGLGPGLGPGPCQELGPCQGQGPSLELEAYLGPE